jgi:phosphoribosylaminoimidazole-succinocarboxamide synthase
MATVVKTDLGGSLKKIGEGKVRDLYEVDQNRLLFVATDRISAYDVVLNNGIPDKGKILTALSAFWFNLLKDEIKSHWDGRDALEQLPAVFSEKQELRNQIEGRSMVVRRYKVLPLEVIVRGYITGSAWKEYVKQGTVHGIKVADGLKENEKFPTPIYTPSTKAEQGEHDENIHPDKAAQIVGADVAKKLEQIAIRLYSKAADYAREKGIIIADTKFEFGLDDNGEIVLLDEVLTPDSSRFWPSTSYTVGSRQTESFDKQFLRNWLTDNNKVGVDGVTLPDDIVEQTRAKYVEIYERITGKKW